MPTTLGYESSAKSARVSKLRTNIHVNLIDNGYVMRVCRDMPDGRFEEVELAFPSIPKLLKAVATFLKEAEDVD